MYELLLEYVGTYGFNGVTYPIAAVLVIANGFILYRGI